MRAESTLRLAAFLAGLALVALWEWAKPDPERRLPMLGRWRTNLGLGLLNVVLVRATIGSLAVAAAVLAQARGWGLFNQLGVPPVPAGVLSVLLLDLAIYAQHVATHAWQPLWRLHQVHHSDLELDATSALRFHPLEIVLSLIYKAILVILLGAPVGAVIAFEMILSLGALFSHAHAGLPKDWDRALRGLVVTPAMHRIHHSDRQRETDSNFGFSFSWWDRIFGTYLAEAGPGSALGLRGLPGSGFVQLLRLPFRWRMEATVDASVPGPLAPAVDSLEAP